MTLTSGERSATAAALLASIVDGSAVSQLLTDLKAAAHGNVAVTNNGDGTYLLSFKKADGSTEAFNKTFNPTTGVRT